MLTKNLICVVSLEIIEYLEEKAFLAVPDL